jgi:hypothetical protein
MQISEKKIAERAYRPSQRKHLHVGDPKSIQEVATHKCPVPVLLPFCSNCTLELSKIFTVLKRNSEMIRILKEKNMADEQQKLL